MRIQLMIFILLLCGLTGSAIAQTGESPGKRPIPQDKNRWEKGPSHSGSTPGADPPAAEIRCRGYRGGGGGGFVFKTIATRKSVTGETIVTVEMAFTPSLAAAGADGRGLRNPGECAFSDRPIRNQEPFRVRFDAVADGQIRQRQHGSKVDDSPIAAERFPDAANIPPYLQDPKHYWSFFITNSNQGYFLATYHRYWRPANRIDITKPDSTPGRPNGQPKIQIRH